MEDEVKPKTPFKFKRPWETPPREEDEQPTHSQHVQPKHEVKSENPVMGNSDNVPLNNCKQEGPDWSEEVEVFRFDRERLVLTSERVRVKQELPDYGSAGSHHLPSSSTRISKSLTHEGRSSFSATGLKQKDIKVEVDVKMEYDQVSFDARGDEENLMDGFDEHSLNGNSSDSDDESDEDDEDECSDEDVVKPRLDDDFPEGRNKERKNSKWADYGVTRKSNRLRSTKSFCGRAHKAQVLKKLTSLLKKDSCDLTEDERINLTAFPELAEEAKKRLEKRHLASERMKEEADPKEELENKCTKLSQVIARAQYVVVYTGAGISTSASIPDYRGPNGIWTLMRKGQAVADDLKQFPQSADPTITHMALQELYKQGIVKHIVSQNVDGLHIRSGIPKTALSEVHGNMYIEVCLECHREYVRLFDVTEKTRRHHHKTGRSCYHCGSALRDSVVLFGEKGSVRWPINWAGAEYNVDKADVILCFGSSLKVLRRYPWLWSMSKPAKQRPKLYIVNLQWTPKDRFAAVKINGPCDEVIARVMDNLQIPIPLYKRENDPIFSIATSLHSSELATRASKDLSFPDNAPYPGKSTDLSNYIRFEPTFCKEVRALNQMKRKLVDGEDEDALARDAIAKPKSCGLGGWLGNALPTKPKKKKLK